MLTVNRFFRPFAFVLALAGAQTTKAQTSPDELAVGGWTTASASKYTVIANAGDRRIYRVEVVMMMDADVMLFDAFVDGKKIPVQFPEAGVLLLEGSSIAIQQTTPGAFVSGNWVAVQTSPIPALKISWAGYPQTGKEVLVTELLTAQEMVLSVNKTSVNCSKGAMNVSVDGAYIKDPAGSVVEFPAGSSVVVKGKRVVVKPIGTCTSQNTINGELRYKKSGP